MRRADRLFQLTLLLRGGRIRTAQFLADELQVSVRTIYRDIQVLSLSGVPVEGEAGVGYRIHRHFELPPLMFLPEELEALAFGARMVKAWTDRDLALAASQALEKIHAVLPQELWADLDNPYMETVNFTGLEISDTLSQLRQAIRQRSVVVLHYTRADGESSLRDVYPLGLFFWGKVWTLASWCTLRQSFRDFRVDRVDQIRLKPQQFEAKAGQTLDDYLVYVKAKNSPGCGGKE